MDRTSQTTEDKVTKVNITAGSEQDVRAGLLGYISCVWAELFALDGLALRRTAEGRLALSFPARTDSKGRRHPYYRPIDRQARERIEAAIFAALRHAREFRE